VVGIDHDHDSRVAVTAAFEFAHRFGLGIIAVHAWSTRQRAGDVALPFMIDTNQLERAAEKHLSDALSAWMELYQDVEVSQIVDLDDPSGALLRRSRDA
jgi:nucleotide-binding universal stress UspA family protein